MGVIRLAYNLVTAFQRTCLQESWQNLTLGKLRYKHKGVGSPPEVRVVVRVVVIDIDNTTRYTDLAPDRFKDFRQDQKSANRLKDL